MNIYVSATVRRSGDGSKEHPFKTISEAALLAKPGDNVMVSPGLYREYVDPARGGEPENRISYISEQPLAAVISGAEPLKGWKQHDGDTWVVRVGNGLFGDYNPYTVAVSGDWYFAPDPVHTGEVYLNGKAMYEVLDLQSVLDPKPFKQSWEPDEVTILKWYTEQDEERNETVIYANFGGKDPNAENVEFNVRRNCFYPSEEGRGYITLSGFTIKQAATQWAPPTAYQDGMVGPHWSKGWIIEDCEISDSRCSGITLGKYLQPENNNKWTTKYLKDGTQTERDNIMQAQFEGWTKETVGSHIVRRCHIHDCGQTGIVGHLGGVFSIIEDNHIHHINNKQDLAGAEIGGIKMHAAIDVIYRRNHIHHCTRGLWLDWQAQGTRVTQNLFHDNTPPAGTDITPLLGLGEDIFIEVSHGPTLIDNNLLLSPCSCRISTQGMAFVHNLIAGSFTYVSAGVENNGAYLPTPRYTPYHMRHRTEVAGFMTILHGDMRFYNNIFVQQDINQEYVDHAKKYGTEKEYNFICGTGIYEGYPDSKEYFSHFGPWSIEDESGKDKYYEKMPVDGAGNIYLAGARANSTEKDAYVDENCKVTLELKENDGKTFLSTNLYDLLPERENFTVSTAILGEAFEPEQRFEDPQGREIIFNEDYFGSHRSVHPLAGPFETKEAAQQELF
ncbi:MAG: right-handed parallel beta-helix repeat-containing protein [Lachnospiraceae bacterium]|nr:right-handed parallel beta-helix repeat-containing protein [Lachnospiraceae bacterium]